MNKRFAIPTVNEKLTAHFGHCENFANVDAKENEIIGQTLINPPVHKPGVYPRFLAEQGVDVIIAGGMGQKAQDLFAQNNIQVCIGVPSEEPKVLVSKYISGELTTGKNLCTH